MRIMGLIQVDNQDRDQEYRKINTELMEATYKERVRLLKDYYIINLKPTSLNRVYGSLKAAHKITKNPKTPLLGERIRIKFKDPIFGLSSQAVKEKKCYRVIWELGMDKRPIGQMINRINNNTVLQTKFCEIWNSLYNEDLQKKRVPEKMAFLLNKINSLRRAAFFN